MEHRNAHSRYSVLWLAVSVLIFCTCDQPFESVCRVQPSVTAEYSMTVNVFDTSAITVNAQDPCGEPLLYLWSFDGGRHYDTTQTPTLLRVFTYDDTGYTALRVRAMNAVGMVSDADVISLQIRDSKFIYKPPVDTFFYFADTQLSIDLRPIPDDPDIFRYFWSFAKKGPFDTLAGGVLSLTLPFYLDNVRTLYLRVQKTSGKISRDTLLYLAARPLLLGGKNTYYPRFVSTGSGSVRAVIPDHGDSAHIHPDMNMPGSNLRLVGIDKSGGLSMNKFHLSTNNIEPLSISSMSGGVSLVTGKNKLPALNYMEIYVSAFDASGAPMWERNLFVDSLNMYPLNVFERTNGNYVILSSHGSRTYTTPLTGEDVVIGPGFYFVEVTSGGDLVGSKAVRMEKMYSYQMNSALLKNGTIVAAGAQVDTATGKYGRLALINFDMSGNIRWERYYATGLGTLIPQNLIPTADGGLAVTGFDYGDAGSVHWFLKTDSLGNQRHYRNILQGNVPMAQAMSGEFVQAYSQENYFRIQFLASSGLESRHYSFEKGNNWHTQESYVFPMADGGFIITYQTSDRVHAFGINGSGAVIW